MNLQATLIFRVVLCGNQLNLIVSLLIDLVCGVVTIYSVTALSLRSFSFSLPSCLTFCVIFQTLAVLIHVEI